MAWTFLAASEASHLGSADGSGLDTIVSSTDTHKAFSYPECPVENCPSHLYGTMCEHLRANTLSCPSTLSMVGSHARILALQELELAWEASEVDFSTTSQGLSAKQTRDSFFSKTSQQLELVASTMSLKHLPNSGMIVAGRLYQPPQLAPVTREKDGSCLLTPTAQNYGSDQGGAAGRVGKIRLSLESMARRGVLPTPTARDWKGPCGANRQSPDLPLTVGGHLNPQFVEEIMGYSIGWTELSAWATQWFRSKSKSRLKN